ncbi:MAG: GTPase ObgE [Geminicoccaceae bacterium]|nr:GTPase ObgE [Geminicoccaceae bacterium]
MRFLDSAKIFIKSGDGGAGACSFRREKFVEFGGPDGGNGGRGGDIVAVAENDLNTLVDFRYQQHFKAGRGGHGMGRSRSGKAGATIELKLPVGTQILDENAEILLADLDRPGKRIVLAQGGDGGFGNEHYKSSTNRAPRRSDAGYPGEERWIWLKLKLLADAGLVGLPNAGKSTFLSAVSRARPKIGDYPFTTLEPSLGTVMLDDRSFVIADIPGLIEGAHEGVGLGDQFLGHVERCAVLIHLVDGTSGNVAEAYATIRHELEAYGHGLADKPELLCLNKIDALTEEAREEARAALADISGSEVHLVSGVSGEGITPVLRKVQAHVIERRRDHDVQRADDET